MISQIQIKKQFTLFVKIKKQQAVRKKTQWLRCYDCRCKTSCVVLQTQAPIVQRDATEFFLFLTSLLLHRIRVDSIICTSSEESSIFEWRMFFKLIQSSSTEAGSFVAYQLFQPASAGTLKFSKI